MREAGWRPLLSFLPPSPSFAGAKCKKEERKEEDIFAKEELFFPKVERERERKESAHLSHTHTNEPQGLIWPRLQREKRTPACPVAASKVKLLGQIGPPSNSKNYQ